MTEIILVMNGHMTKTIGSTEAEKKQNKLFRINSDGSVRKPETRLFFFRPDVMLIVRLCLTKFLILQNVQYFHANKQTYSIGRARWPI